ncbi:MAG: Arabinose efflux permease, partial [Clostridia bacterium 62_21]
VCGLGVAAYHPEGARITFFAAPGHRRATTMALFGVCGNVGWGLGPAAAALLVGAAGREGAAGLVVPGLLMALVLLVYRARPARSAREREQRHRRTRPAGNEGKPHWGAAAVLVLVVTVSYWAYVGSATYIPLFYTAHLGADPSRSGFVLSLFLLGGAAGTLAGGWLSDRRGRRPVMQGALALSVLPLLLFPQAGGAGSVVLAGLAGFVLGSIWGVATVYAQELLPHHPGLAAGLVHGLPAGLGGLATLFLGLVADRWGVPIAMTVLALLPVPGLFLSFRLPGQDRRAARALRGDPKPSNSG